MSTSPTVFLVDDDEGVRDSITIFLQVKGFTVEAFASANDFLDAYSEEREGCLVLDVTLPGMSGLALQETLTAKHLRIPIIFITGYGDVSMSVKAMKAGAFDLIEKPIDPEKLSQRIHEAIEWDLDRRRAERSVQELAHDAMHDPLTGLVNRREFEKRLEHAVVSSKTRGTQHTLCFIDLDQFKIVNDTAGHAAGDELLRQVTALLADKVRERDTLARLGGDEFGLLLNNCPTEKALKIAEELIAEVRGFRFVVDDQLFKIGASVGVVPVTYQAATVNELLRQADSACYSAKQLGRNRVSVWQSAEGPATAIQLQRASDLSVAISKNNFLLYRQPIVSLLPDREETTAHELLIRLVGHGGEIMLPSAFIPTAERHGLMSAIDHWVIHSALHCYSEISGASTDTEIAINLSGSSLNDESLLDFVHHQFGNSRTPPDRVCFEISETTAVHHLNRAQHFIKETRSLGCRFALDNFGSGMSSFSYLKKLDVDYVKIDGTYVRDMLTNPFYFSMVEAISNIGHSLGVRIVAEWVESLAIVDRLKDLGVDYAQGKALHPPEPLSAESLRSCSGIQSLHK